MQRRFVIAISLLILLSLIVPIPVAYSQGQVPRLPRTVTDLVGQLNPSDIAEIERVEREVANNSCGDLQRMYVLLTPNFSGFGDAVSYGNEVFRVNGLGKGDVILIIEFAKHELGLIYSNDDVIRFDQKAPNGSMTWSKYVREVVVGPKLRSDFKGGIVSGIREVGKILTQSGCAQQQQPAAPVVQQPIVVQPQQTQQAEGASLVLICLIVLVVVLIVVLVIAAIGSSSYSYDDPYSRRPSRRRRDDDDEPESISFSWPAPSPGTPWTGGKSSGGSSGWGSSSGGSSSSDSGSGGSASSDSGSGGSSSSSSGSTGGSSPW